MINIENTMVTGWEPAIRGARNPMNSWEKSDTLVDNGYCKTIDDIFGETVFEADDDYSPYYYSGPFDKKNQFSWAMDHNGRVAFKRWPNEFAPVIGPNDLKLLTNLAKAGSDEAKFRRMIVVYVDITAPLYWWKEADTYKVGTVRNSCSTMHKIHAKEFTLDDFSTEHLFDKKDFINGDKTVPFENDPALSAITVDGDIAYFTSTGFVEMTCDVLNHYRDLFLKTHDKKYWWQMIQLLPSSYNQRATLMLNYEVLANMYHARKNHKLDEWRDFCKWIETLPYAKELIIGKQETVEDVLPAQMLSKMTFSKEKWDEITAGTVGPIDNTPFQMRKDILEPVSIDKDRILMKHCEEKDGLIELRKGVSDISIGDALYAQVIIRYDDDHYIKGMAIYSDDIPAGVDMVVNYGPKDPVRAMTNKCAFSANDHRPIKQQFYDNDAKLSPINIIAMECDLVEDLGGK